jgi:hypothetical protein
MGPEENHLTGAHYSGDAGGFVVLDYGVPGGAPALVERNPSGNGEARRLVRLLLAPQLLNGTDILESQQVIHPNPETTIALHFVILHVPQENGLTVL